MIPLKRQLMAEASSVGLRLDAVQQDYLLTWILKGISERPLLRDTLVFKGGTSLKKCFYKEYRFSEDLDFSALADAPNGQQLESEITAVCAHIEDALTKRAPIVVRSERYREREPHPEGQEAFVIRAQFPWQRQPLTRIMVEITRNETIVFPTENRPLLHSFEPELVGNLQTYSLEEIVLEKLRAILQHTKKLHERDWSRSRARDYYDLWRILCENQLSVHDAPKLLQKKCRGKEVSFSTTNDFFDPVMIAHVRQTWSQWLAPLVREVPPISILLDQLHPRIKQLIESH